MKAMQLVHTLRHLHLLKPKPIMQLLASWYQHGTNLMMLLAFTSKWKPDGQMIAVDGEEQTYKDMYDESMRLAQSLKEKYGITQGMCVAFVCHTELRSVQALFAVSRLGASCHLINPELSEGQLIKLLNQEAFDYIIWGQQEDVVTGVDVIDLTTATSTNLPIKIPRAQAAPIVLRTGGTTGQSKQAYHRPSITSYLAPFQVLLKELGLLSKKSVYCATPLYHGYGLALLIACLASGKPIVLTRRFSVECALETIEQYEVDMMSAVPLIIDRLIRADPDRLKTLTCIASGGAELSPKVIAAVQKHLGLVLYNLYGTSETGLNTIATPEDLARSPRTIGRPLPAMQLTVLNPDGLEVSPFEIGEFHIENDWSMSNANTVRMSTGDMGYKDASGLYFLVGRKDDRIDSAGETVYPLDIERIVLTHPSVQDVTVTSVEDVDYGKRLEVYVVLETDTQISEVDLRAWLKENIARYEMPRAIHFCDSLAYTALGKKVRRGGITTSLVLSR